MMFSQIYIERTQRLTLMIVHVYHAVKARELNLFSQSCGIYQPYL